MNEYCPDRWVVLKLEPKDDDTKYRLFGGWYGGYLNGDSWRANSGIIKIVEQETHYEVYGTSGSIYKCAKGCEGLSGYMSSVLNSFQTNANGARVSVCDIAEAMRVVNDEPTN